MLELYLLRHGETDYNLKKIVQGGGIDSDLNETGLAQAAAFYTKYDSTLFDGIFASELKRANQTIAKFESTLQIQRLAAFNEMNWGILEGAKSTPETQETFNAINADWANGNLTAGVEGGESPVQVWNRVEIGLAQIRKDFPRGSVLVCTHGRVLRIILSMLMGYGMHHMTLFGHSNTGLNVLRIAANGVCFAEKLNDTKHLS